MSFTTSTLDVGSPTPALDLMTAFDAVITGDDAWEFVEETDDGSTGRCRMYRLLSTAVGNVEELELYVGITRLTDAATAVHVVMAEGWDAVAKELLRFAPAYAVVSGNGRVNSVVTTAGSADLGLFLTAQRNRSPFDATHVERQVINISAGQRWWASITPKRLLLAGPTDAVYAGFFDHLTTRIQDPFPAALVRHHVSQSTAINLSATAAYTNTGAMTRSLIGSGSIATAQFGAKMGRLSVPGRADGSNTEIKETLTGLWMPSRIWMSGALSSDARIRGFLHESLACSIAGGVNGDTLTVDGRLYVRLSGDAVAAAAWAPTDV